MRGEQITPESVRQQRKNSTGERQGEVPAVSDLHGVIPERKLHESSDLSSVPKDTRCPSCLELLSGLQHPQAAEELPKMGMWMEKEPRSSQPYLEGTQSRDARCCVQSWDPLRHGMS